MHKRILFVIVLGFMLGVHLHSGGNMVQAQVTGKVRISSIPEQGVLYVLDNKYPMRDRQITLTEGDHRFIFWAPEHQMLDTSVFVMGNWTLDLKVHLQRPPEYIAYREAVDRYHRRQRLARIIPPIVAGGIGAWAAISTVQYGRAHSDLKDLGVAYETSSTPSGILQLKEVEIPQAKEDFRNARTQTYISSGLFVVSLGAVAYIRSKLSREGPPVYQDEERLRFEGLVWTPSPAGGYWSTGISLAIQ